MRIMDEEEIYTFKITLIVLFIVYIGMGAHNPWGVMRPSFWFAVKYILSIYLITVLLRRAINYFIK